MTVHESITDVRIIIDLEADDFLGFCIACGETNACIEPDAREYACEACGDRAVYGVQELLLSGLYYETEE